MFALQLLELLNSGKAKNKTLPHDADKFQRLSGECDNLFFKNK